MTAGIRAKLDCGLLDGSSRVFNFVRFLTQWRLQKVGLWGGTEGTPYICDS